MGIKKSSLEFWVPLPDQGLPRNKCTVHFKCVILLIYDEFLDFPAAYIFLRYMVFLFFFACTFTFSLSFLIRTLTASLMFYAGHVDGENYRQGDQEAWGQWRKLRSCGREYSSSPRLQPQKTLTKNHQQPAAEI